MKLLLCAAILTIACFARGASPPTETATAFVKRASQQLNEVDRRFALAEFVAGTDGTPEHIKALEEVRLERSQLGVALWKQAGAYEGLKLPPLIERQIQIMRVPPALPSPFDAVLASELISIQSAREKNYTDAQDCAVRSPCRKKTPLYDILRDSRSPDELLSAWREWHDYGAAIRPGFQRTVELVNRGAQDFGYADAGVTLRAQYELPAEQFAAEYARLWKQVRPLYEALHCHVRAKLNEHYGSTSVPQRGPIPAHLVGNMWGQNWQSIDGLLDIPPASAPIDVTKALEDGKYGPREIVRTAEGFFRSMGFERLPEKFWKGSVLAPIPGKVVDCHPSAWPIDPAHDDVRLKFCVETTEDHFQTAHHELGHIYYFLAYAKQPYLFQDGANPGFHEALGDALALAITPDYLEKIGLVPKGSSGESNDLPYLMRVALDKLPAIATSITVDSWRWKVYSGAISPEQYNQGWWEQVREYQGLAPPTLRSEQDFDAGMFYHISYGVPYDRYFIAGLLEFDFYRALCKAAGHQGPLHRCSFFGSKAAGDRLRAAMRLGMSQSWPATLQELTGSSQIDGSALVEYLAPVAAWLKKQNEGRQCGWALP